MKHLNKILTMSFLCVALAGCGAAEVLTSGCGGDLDDLCTMVFGSEPVSGRDLETLRRELEEDGAALREEIERLYALLREAEVEQEDAVEALEQDIAELQEQLLDTEVEVAELSTGARVQAFIDPCGDDPGQFDEILLLMTTGEYVAYFQSGSRRFLTVLSDGSYTTTDRQKCDFTISEGAFND